MIGSGRTAPARLLLVLGAAVLASAPALAQQRRATPQAQAARPAPQRTLPAPDGTAALKLLWSTMAAVDQANKTGNYSVLRDLGSQGFQTNNNAASLAGVFAGIRDQRVDLSDTLVVLPSYEIAPSMIEPGLMRMRGTFNMRPVGVGFDLIYAWEQGWRLHGVSVVPFTPGAPVRR